MQIDDNKIAEIIDTVKDGVAKSWVGEIYTYGGTPEKPTKTVNQVAYNLYLTVLAGFIAKLDTVEIVPTPPPSMFDITNLQTDN